ncbi:MAG: hypothetical protein QOJ65_1710 [Fimbriimonadaceae bacterium]|nr:hypothetical protein [Fimbriimonadaceae bacterium]
MTEEEFKARTKGAALEVIELVEGLPRSRAAEHFGRQLLRSSSSVAANYRAVCRARSDAEMAAKLGIVEEEADESIFWMEMVVDAGIVQRSSVEALDREYSEILAMTVASRKTIRRKIDREGSVIRESLAEDGQEVLEESALVTNRQSAIGNRK